MGLRLDEGLNLTVHDIDSQTMRVHIREGKSGKDRMVPLPLPTASTAEALTCSLLYGDLHFTVSTKGLSKAST